MKHLHSRYGAAVAVAGSLLGAVVAATVAVAGDADAPSADRAALLGGALPGGAVISARSVVLTPVAGGNTVATPIASDGSFRAVGLPPGPYGLQLTSVSVPKQTQGATFGEKVQSGLAQTGSALSQGASLAGKSKHDTAKNSVGNIRGREAPPPAAETTAEAASVARLPDANSMPARISMNVTVARRTATLEVDGSGLAVEVGADGSLSGRVAAR